MEAEILREAFRKAGVLTEEAPAGDPVTKTDLYLAGLSGRPDSAAARRALQARLGLPAMLSANALLEVLNAMMTREAFLEMTSGKQE